MSRAIRWIILGLVLGVFVVIITSGIFNESKKVVLDEITLAQAWDKNATISGEQISKRHYIMYTDLACPYCDAFSRIVHDNYDEFKQFIADNQIMFEIRLTDFLYEYGEHRPEMSRWSAEAAYCASNEGRFLDYYYAAIDALWRDYHSKGIGVSKTSPKIEDMTALYWQKIGEEIGLSDEFISCYNDHKMLDKVQENTARAVSQVQGGLPYFQFGKFVTGGFDQSWGWDSTKRLLEAGL